MESINVFVADNKILINNTEELHPDVKSSSFRTAIKIGLNGNIETIKVLCINPNGNPIRFNESITDTEILGNVTQSLVGSGSLMRRITEYVHSLASDDKLVIEAEYKKYEIDDIVFGFVASLGVYIGFILLNSISVFTNQLPIQFTLPYDNPGSCISKNVFHYLSLPMIALSKIVSLTGSDSFYGTLLQLTLFIQTFMNIWEPVFVEGPFIPCFMETKMCIQTLNSFSQCVISELHRYKISQESIESRLLAIESRLSKSIEDSIVKMNSNVNALITETRENLSVADKSLHKDQEQQLKDLISEEHNKSESEMKSAIEGLEHRVEVLYSKVSRNNTTNGYDQQREQPEHRDQQHHEHPREPMYHEHRDQQHHDHHEQHRDQQQHHEQHREHHSNDITGISSDNKNEGFVEREAINNNSGQSNVSSASKSRLGQRFRNFGIGGDPRIKNRNIRSSYTPTHTTQYKPTVKITDDSITPISKSISDTNHNPHHTNHQQSTEIRRLPGASNRQPRRKQEFNSVTPIESGVKQSGIDRSVTGLSSRRSIESMRRINNK